MRGLRESSQIEQQTNPHLTTARPRETMSKPPISILPKHPLGEQWVAKLRTSPEFVTSSTKMCSGSNQSPKPCPTNRGQDSNGRTTGNNSIDKFIRNTWPQSQGQPHKNSEHDPNIQRPREGSSLRPTTLRPYLWGAEEKSTCHPIKVTSNRRTSQGGLRTSRPKRN